MKSKPKTNEKFVKIDSDTARKLSKLGYMYETPSDLIKKMVGHIHVCDQWCLERDEEDES